MKTEGKFLTACRGQAITELTILLPVMFLLVSAPSTINHLFNDRIQSAALSLDRELQKFEHDELNALLRIKHSECLRMHWSPADNTDARWPHEVDQQRALSLGIGRLACLSEATARLGPKVALPLWAFHLSAPSESAARTSAQTLCPRFNLSTENVRSAAAAGHRLIRARNALLAAQIGQQAISQCTSMAKSAPLLDRPLSHILDP